MPKARAKPAKRAERSPTQRSTNPRVLGVPSINGRDGEGRFVEGWKGGPGNPHIKQVQELRSALMRRVTPDDIEQIAQTLVDNAKAGDSFAIAQILDRTVGKVISDEKKAEATGGILVLLGRLDAAALAGAQDIAAKRLGAPAPVDGEAEEVE